MKSVLTDPFVLTLLFLFFSSLFISLLRRIRKDSCLKNFEGDLVIYENIDKEIVCSGLLNIESTGIEFLIQDKDSPFSSYILYDNEFHLLRMLIRRHELQTPKRIEQLLKLRKKLNHPGLINRFSRQIRTFFKLINDSFAELFNLLLNYAKKSKTTAAILNSQSGYVNKMKSEIIETVGKAYDPLIEKYIGKKVEIEILEKEELINIEGILMSYTVNFLEFSQATLLDYNKIPYTADIIVPQKICIIRKTVRTEPNVI